MNDIVGQYRECSFGFDPSEPLCEESTAAAHAFDCVEGMLDRATPHTHQTRVSIYPGLHAVERALTDQSVHGSLRARRTLWLQRARLVR